MRELAELRIEEFVAPAVEPGSYVAMVDLLTHASTSEMRGTPRQGYIYVGIKYAALFLWRAHNTASHCASLPKIVLWSIYTRRPIGLRVPGGCIAH